MTIEFVNGDLLDALDNQEVNVICHVVNCRGVMGGGIAKSIRERYPSVYKDYRELYQKIGGGADLLGYSQICCIDPEGVKTVFNLHAQLDYGTHKRQLNYGALGACFYEMLTDLHSKDIVGFPYLLGCGLAGGDWSIVLEMIKYYFKDHTVKIYKL